MSKSARGRPPGTDRGLNRGDFGPFQTDSKDLITALLPRPPVRSFSFHAAEAALGIAGFGDKQQELLA